MELHELAPVLGSTQVAKRKGRGTGRFFETRKYRHEHHPYGYARRSAPDRVASSGFVPIVSGA